MKKSHSNESSIPDLDSELHRGYRWKRPHSARCRSERTSRLSKAKVFRDGKMYPEETKHLRPKTRAECKDGPRPCPFVSCKYHLYLDVNPKTGSIKYNFPDLEVSQMAHSCALDFGDFGTSLSLKQTAATINLTFERIRQLEILAFQKVQNMSTSSRDFIEFIDNFAGKMRSKHRLPVLPF